MQVLFMKRRDSRIMDLLKGPIGRREFFIAFLSILAVSVIGGYAIFVLLSMASPSSWHVVITFVWSLLNLSIFTFFAMRRAMDIGISKWWVVLLWLPALFDLRLLMLLGKYAGIGISLTAVAISGTAASLSGLVLLAILLFSRGN
jgi:uncharacterized membrane protein YhaH (DUF805 family)